MGLLDLIRQLPTTGAAKPGSVAGTRVSLTVPGLDRPDDERRRRDLCAAVQELPGVEWAVVNAPLHRLVVGIRPPGPARSELLDVVHRVTRRQGPDLHLPPGQGARQTSPGPGPAGDLLAEVEPPDAPGAQARAVTALVADVAGLVIAGVGRTARWVPLPPEAGSLVTAIDSQPRLRQALERTFGRTSTDTGLAVAAAIAQGLSRGYTGLGVDGVIRAAQLAEVRARRAAWTAREAAMFRDAEHARADPVVVERPRPCPEGPVEQYAPRTVGVAAAGAALALSAGGRTGLAGAVALATLPKAAAAGREVFAVQLARALAARRTQVMDRGVLRRLDRIDTVVLDTKALTISRLMVTDVVTLPGADAEQAQLHLHDLFHPDDVGRVSTADGWWLGPPDDLDLRGRIEARERRRLADDDAPTVLGLAHGTRLEALVTVAPQPADSADTLVAAARRARADLVLAGSPLHGRPVDARLMPGGTGLLGTVRQLQAEGHVVLLVSRQAQALAGADCGIGVDGTDGTPPWGAHLLVGEDLEAAALVIDAVEVARTVSRRGVLLAEAGTAVGAVGAATDPRRGAGRRALLAVNGAAALSLVQGAWEASQLSRRPVSPPVSMTPWHVLQVGKVLSLLDSDREGLTARQARARRRSDGAATPPPPGLLQAFGEELANPLTPILAGGAALSAAIGSVIDAGVVAGASAFGAMVGAAQRTLTDRAVEDLLTRSAVIGTVWRDGELVRLPADQLVPGDVVLLVPGDVVPADARVLEAEELELDESSLTGESFPVAKTITPVVASDVAERASMVYEGTTVAGGRGVAVVVATGTATEAGRSMATAQQAAPATGVEHRLAQITHTTLPIALGSGAAVVAAGLLRGRPARQTVGAGVGLAVASVPEGLPFLVGAAQLAAARRLSGQAALVRNARTIEALGRVDVLCFDKTGTLTQGRISLSQVSDGATVAALDALATPRLRGVVAAGLRATPVPPPGRRLLHLTDRAVRDGAQQLGIDEQVDAPGWTHRGTLPFEPSRGYHAAVGALADGRLLLSVKGAPETVLGRCIRRRDGSGDVALQPHGRRRLREELDRLTAQGFRVLAVAEAAPTDLPAPTVGGDVEFTDDTVNGLTFIGFLALADPVRGSAGSSLEELRNAGAQIVMITGDHPGTAEAIADELGILNGHRVVTGAEIDSLDDEGLAELVPRIAVVARGTPAHKVRVVKAFQRAGRVVAMTGDGANDAPAIRLADVGIALGRRGTPAARAAADLVVTDDRLETIIAALIEGRAMWRSVREALAILVGGNLGEIGFTLLGAAATGVSPLSARQLLLVNLLTDLAPALAIALRRPARATTADLLTEGPETSLGTALTSEVVLRAATTTLGASAGWLAARVTGRAPRARTVALASLVGTQLGQTLLIGRSSPTVVAASVGSAAVLAAVVQTPGLSQFFGCTPIGPLGWGIATAAATGATLASAALPTLSRFLPEPLRSARRWEEYLQPDHLAALVRRPLSAECDVPA
jgi:cation-transporting ATPase I